jgi:DNA-3-methyladenine glycosylase
VSPVRLQRSFYARPSTDVAPDLLGRVLVRRLEGGTRLAARIVETEAYQQDDPASHSFRGRTPRNGVMFGPAGYLYVYFTYGMHHCMNVVTGADGVGSAVLLRAAEPLEGLDEMARLRGHRPARELCSGPARLCAAFGVDRSHDGTDLVAAGSMWVEPGDGGGAGPVTAGVRVGISAGLDRAWRFSIEGDPWVSRGRPGPGRPGPRRNPRTRPSTR